MSFVEHLIEEVRRHPCLWNKTLEDYRNQNIRDNAWDSISEELNKTVKELKREWKKLQDAYRQAMLRRIVKSDDEAKKMKPWRYEEMMSFLLSDLISRETISNIEVIDCGQYEDSLDSTIKSNNEETEQTDSVIITDTDRRNKKRGNMESNDDKVLSFPQHKNKQKKQADELDLFFGSVCESTKRLPRHLQLQIKSAVMKVVIKAETEVLVMDREGAVTFTE